MAAPQNQRRPLYVEPPAGEVPTLETLWETYGGWLQGYVRRSFGDDEYAVEVCCRAVLVRAGKELLETLDSPPAGADLSWWLQRLADDAIATIEREGLEPETHAADPLPLGLPTGLRAMLRMRASTEAAMAALDREGATGPIGRAVVAHRRRWRDNMERYLRHFPVAALLGSLRSWWRRTEATLGSLTSASSNGVNAIVASAGLTQAAAFLTVVAVGIAGPTPAALPTAPLDALAVADRVSVVVPMAESAIQAATLATAATPVSEGEGQAPPGGLASPPTTSPPGGASLPPTPVGVAPRVEAEPAGDGKDPIQGNPHDRGIEFSTADGRVTVDLEGDGDDEASVATPYAFAECPKPEDRGPATAAACPVLEDTTS